MNSRGRWLSDTFAWLFPDTDTGQHVDYPPAPEGELIYVIGDIHGCADLVEELRGRIDRDAETELPKKPLEIYLGDYVDRGPASADVIGRLIERKDERKTVFLRGNHEKVLEDFLRGEVSLDEWRPFGGLETLISYGIDADLLLRWDNDASVRNELIERMPDGHRSFLRDLRPHYGLGAYFFVHAGIRPGVAFDQQVESDCLWIRDEFLEHADDFGRVVVHGHSPVPTPELLPNRINLDTAAYATGRLSCLKISERGARLF